MTIFFSAVLLVSLGMCGLTVFGNGGVSDAALIEALLVLGSFIGLVVTLIVALIRATITGRGDKVQKLFDDRDKKK
ncbi:MAG TPA: hypothetical protein VGL22_06360 [Terracidiphilus sp.]